MDLTWCFAVFGLPQKHNDIHIPSGIGVDFLAMLMGTRIKHRRVFISPAGICQPFSQEIELRIL
jgi:hypothetical protein